MRNKSLFGVMPYAFFRGHEVFNNFVSNVFMQCYAYWWGIELGKDRDFHGITHLKRHYISEISIGSNCTFRSSFLSNTIGLKQKCFLSTTKGAQIVIGNRCGFSGVSIAANQRIKIGDNVFCGANVTISDSDRHPLDAIERIAGKAGKTSPVTIEDNVWLGMNVVVLKGVTIGKGSVIAANSVVTKDVPCNVVAGGIPAKVISPLRGRFDDEAH